MNFKVNKLIKLIMDHMHATSVRCNHNFVMIVC